MSRRGVVRGSGGTSLVEALFGIAIASLVIGMAYGLLHQLMGSGRRSNVTGLSKRSFLQKDTKAAVRLIAYRLREAIQILSPAAGTAADEVVFRDVTNVDVRLRLDGAEHKVISERRVDGAWVREKDPITVGPGTLPASWPVQVASCQAIRFTALSGSALAVHATLETDGTLGTLMTVVKLRNAGRAY